MELKCLTFHFKDALNLAEKISSKNITLPILNSVLISSEKKEMKLTATNLEIGIEIKIPAKIEKEGKVAVPVKLIYNFISNLPTDETVSLKVSRNNLLIETSHSSTIIKGYSPEDFPLFPSVKEKENSFIFAISDFLLGLNAVYYAASLTEIKPEIASVFISSSKNTPLTFVATDSFRLARKTLHYNFSNFPLLLIPYRNVLELIRIFENEKGDIKLIPSKNQLFLISDKIKFVSRLTEGTFPDYEEIIPKTSSTDVIINKQLFNNNLKIAGVFSGKLNEFKLEIIPDKKILKVQTSNSDFGEHVSSIPADINGEKLKIAFNHRYLVDGLRFISSDKVLLRFNGENKPLLMTDPKDNSFCYLVMPMKDI